MVYILLPRRNYNWNDYPLSCYNGMYYVKPPHDEIQSGGDSRIRISYVSELFIPRQAWWNFLM